MSVWAVFEDGYEDGRRMRHVVAVCKSFEEAQREVTAFADIGMRVAVRRCEDEAEARALEIGPTEFDDQAECDERWLRNDVEQSFRRNF